jgi:autophagy-related protein 2
VLTFLQTFEAVVPTERTVISLKIGDGSVRLLAPSHKGSLVLAIGGMNFATDIVGNFPDTSFRVDVPAMSVMAIEDVGDERQPKRAGDAAKDSLHWKVCTVLPWDEYDGLTTISRTSAMQPLQTFRG